jgi:hypothetical protein
MTKKDFELIASALRQARPDPYAMDKYHGWREAVEQLAVALTTTNPRFDVAVFKAAAGYVMWEGEA